ncbi:MAG: hypothetical protein ACREMW_00620 [Gemmatimonadales bacterium]
MNNTLVAAAGEHYVAYRLSCLGYLAASVRVGSPAADLLASTLDGGRTVAIQVKTTQSALRTRGRGEGKVPHHLEFPLGHAAVEKASDKLLFCFVDLRGSHPATTPDVYVVPAAVILKEYKGKNIRQHTFFRHHRSIEHMAPFKNAWEPLIKALS